MVEFLHTKNTPATTRPSCNGAGMVLVPDDSERNVLKMAPRPPMSYYEVITIMGGV